MSTPNIDYLREQVTKLKALLDDPHPGLSTWCAMYGECMKSISYFWGATEDIGIKATIEKP